jgi:hypothetical protein
MRRARLALFSLLALACNGDDELVVQPFNNAADTISIEVAPGPPGEAVTVDLTSNTGQVVIGSATVDPGRAPVGTNHTLVVQVFDEWEDRIELATITSQGDRGIEEYPLRQDAADPGFFDLTLTSLGVEGETRTDVWRVTLFEPVDAPEIVVEDTDQ